MLTNVVDIPNLNDEELIFEHNTIVVDYKCELKKQQLFNEAIGRWRNSKEPEDKRRKHITSLMVKLDSSFKMSDDLKAKVKLYEYELRKRNISFEKLP